MLSLVFLIISSASADFYFCEYKTKKVASCDGLDDCVCPTAPLKEARDDPKGGGGSPGKPGTSLPCTNTYLVCSPPASKQLNPGEIVYFETDYVEYRDCNKDYSYWPYLNVKIEYDYSCRKYENSLFLKDRLGGYIKLETINQSYDSEYVDHGDYETYARKIMGYFEVPGGLLPGDYQLYIDFPYRYKYEKTKTEWHYGEKEDPEIHETEWRGYNNEITTAISLVDDKDWTEYATEIGNIGPGQVYWKTSESTKWRWSFLPVSDATRFYEVPGYYADEGKDPVSNIGIKPFNGKDTTFKKQILSQENKKVVLTFVDLLYANGEMNTVPFQTSDITDDYWTHEARTDFVEGSNELIYYAKAGQFNIFDIGYYDWIPEPVTIEIADVKLDKEPRVDKTHSYEVTLRSDYPQLSSSLDVLIDDPAPGTAQTKEYYKTVPSCDGLDDCTCGGNCPPGYFCIMSFECRQTIASFGYDEIISTHVSSTGQSETTIQKVLEHTPKEPGEYNLIFVAVDQASNDIAYLETGINAVYLAPHYNKIGFEPIGGGVSDEAGSSNTTALAAGVTISALVAGAFVGMKGIGSGLKIKSSGKVISRSLRNSEKIINRLSLSSDQRSLSGMFSDLFAKNKMLLKEEAGKKAEDERVKKENREIRARNAERSRLASLRAKLTGFTSTAAGSQPMTWEEWYASKGIEMPENRKNPKDYSGWSAVRAEQQGKALRESIGNSFTMTELSNMGFVTEVDGSYIFDKKGYEEFVRSIKNAKGSINLSDLSWLQKFVPVKDDNPLNWYNQGLTTSLIQIPIDEQLAWMKKVEAKQKQIEDYIDAFLLGYDPNKQGLDGLFADITAGILVYGDLRDIALYTAQQMGVDIGPDVNEFILTFAFIGLLTTVNPGIDTVPTVLKSAFRGLSRELAEKLSKLIAKSGFLPYLTKILTKNPKLLSEMPLFLQFLAKYADDVGVDEAFALFKKIDFTKLDASFFKMLKNSDDGTVLLAYLAKADDITEAANKLVKLQSIGGLNLSAKEFSNILLKTSPKNIDDVMTFYKRFIKLNSELPPNLKIKNVKLLTAGEMLSMQNGKIVSMMVDGEDLYVNAAVFKYYADEAFTVFHEFGHVKFTVDEVLLSKRLSNMNLKSYDKIYNRIIHGFEGHYGGLRNIDGNIHQHAAQNFIKSKKDFLKDIKKVDFYAEDALWKEDYVYSLAERYRLLQDIDKESAKMLKEIVNDLPKEYQTLFNDFIRLFNELIETGEKIW